MPIMFAMEHFGCACVDQAVKQRGVKYVCKQCKQKQIAQSASDVNLLRPSTVEAKSARKKAASKSTSRKSRQRNPTESLSSSARSALLTEKLKLIEEEKQIKEQELAEQEEIRKRTFEEKERQLEEKRKILERKLQEELNQKRKQQQIRRESFEKRKQILQQMAAVSTGGSSIIRSEEKVNNWLSEQERVRGNPDVVETQVDYSVNFVPTMVPEQTVHTKELPAVNNLHNRPVTVHTHSLPPAPHTHTPPPAHNILQQAQINARHVIGRDLQHLVVPRKSGLCL